MAGIFHDKIERTEVSKGRVILVSDHLHCSLRPYCPRVIIHPEDLPERKKPLPHSQGFTLVNPYLADIPERTDIRSDPQVLLKIPMRLNLVCLNVAWYLPASGIRVQVSHLSSWVHREDWYPSR